MASFASHLSKELKELIKKIGETKSKQEEDRIIIAELAGLKPKLAEKHLTPKQIKEHLIRALYIEMLGHSASFAHIHAINLTQSKNLVLKRIGYLMCSLFFDKNSDLLIMLVATILKDLTNGDVHEIVICLTSLGNIMNATIASSIQEHVLRLLSHTTDLVRKKAVLVLQKIKQETGAAVPEYKEKMKKTLCDREPSVMAASLSLYLDEVRDNPRKYRDLTSSFVIILKQVIEHKLPKEFDYHRHPAPWIQIKLLKILQALGKGDQKSSQHCYTVLEHVLRRAEQTNNNISIAITYQCVKTIANIYPYPGLLTEAASALTKYLEASSTNNMKYLGIQALSMLYKSSPKLLDDHQLTIVECLESKDETLKKQTLDLLFKMTTQQNIEIIVSKMLNSLHGSTDHFFRNDLVLKITELAERFCTSHAWYISTMQLLFQLGSEYLSENILNNFLRLVNENYQTHAAFGPEIIARMEELMDKMVPTDFVIKAASWVLGQIGASCYAGDSQQLSRLFGVARRWLETDCQHASTKKWVVDAMLKLATAPDFGVHSEMKLVLQKYSRHTDLQLYQRVLESRRLAKYNLALRNSHQMQLSFEEGLPFLQSFVDQARAQGAREYSRGRTHEVAEANVRLTPYPTQQMSSAFETFLKEKEEKKEEKVETSYEARQVKPSFVSPADVAAREKDKKKPIAPEDRAKQNMAKSLFGGLKGPSKPAPKAALPEPKKKGPEPPGKKLPKVETADLL